MLIKLANPRGFCAGVDRAIEIVNRALEVFGPPIYVRHEVVHNKFVVEDLRARGAVFVEELDQVPDDVIVIFSAHGVSQAVRAEADRRGGRVMAASVGKVRPEARESGLFRARHAFAKRLRSAKEALRSVPDAPSGQFSTGC